MSNSINLDTYFDRIGWAGTTEPTLQTLNGLLDAHISHIPFENFDVLLGRPIKLDIISLQNKICRDRRGGYCFEHAALFNNVLEALGFNPVQHAGRITRVQPRSEAHRGHTFSIVNIGGVTYVVDPGFSAYSSRRSLPLEVSAKSAGSTHWFTKMGNDWVLNVSLPGAEFQGWMSTLEQFMGDHRLAAHIL